MYRMMRSRFLNKFNRIANNSEEITDKGLTWNDGNVISEWARLGKPSKIALGTQIFLEYLTGYFIFPSRSHQRG
jgi:hypothetical protein